ncbi:uncharacterized protein LOC144197115 isoform X2 [Stigmatopora nigra]
MLKELMKERLNLAADEIYKLFEVTIEDYEEKLNRSREEHERRESELVDAVAELRVRLLKRIKQDEALQLIKKEKEELECSTQNDHFPPLLEAPPTEENNDNATAFLPEYEENLPSEPESLFAPLSEADFKSSGSSETYDSDDDDRHVARKDARRAAAMTIRKDAAVPSTGETHQLVQSGHLGQIVTVTFENGQEEDDNAKPRRDFDDFNCPQCEKTFYSKKGLKNHMSTHAPEVKIAPPAARKYFLKDFIKQEDDDDEFAVPSNLCDGVEAKKKAQNVKDTDFQCSVCQQIFESKTALKGHLRQHTNEPTLTCQFCEQKFTRKHNLKKHLRLHMPDKDSWRNQFKIQDSICPQCGKMFDNGSKMLHHMAKCKRLACKICGKRFSRKHNLMNHTMQKHNGENATENPASADGPSSSKSYRRGQNGEERRSGLDAGECSGVDGGAEERRQLILKTKMETIGPLPEMIDTKRHAYQAQFKVQAINHAMEHGNRAAAREFHVNESMIRNWRKQENKLRRAKKQKLSFRGHKARWPELETQLEQWILDVRAVGRNVSTVTIRLRAKALAEELKIQHFQGGPSWCFRFMKRHHLSIKTWNSVPQILAADGAEKMADFRSSCAKKINDKLMQPHNITNMDEVPLTFDIPVKNGTATLAIRKTVSFTVVLGCHANGQKLPPMVIFKQKTPLQEVFPDGVVVKTNQNGWMDQDKMRDWLRQVYVERPDGSPSLLICDSMPGHLSVEVANHVMDMNSELVVIPRGLTKELQPLDIGVKRAFKAKLRAKWEHWMIGGEHGFMDKRVSYATICQWIVAAWANVSAGSVLRAFAKAAIVGVEPNGNGSDSDDEEKEPGVFDESFAQLFNSDTENEDFDGFGWGDDDDDEDVSTL